MLECMVTAFKYVVCKKSNILLLKKGKLTNTKGKFTNKKGKVTKKKANLLIIHYYKYNNNTRLAVVVARQHEHIQFSATVGISPRIHGQSTHAAVICPT